MRALLYKDFVSSKSTYLASFLIASALVAYGFSQRNFLFLPLLCVYMPIILNGVSLGAEAQCDFPKFVFTTPILRKHYVRSKYVLPLLFSLLAFVLTFTYLMVMEGFIGPALLVSIAASALPLLLASLQLPFMLKFGAEKSQLIMLATFMVLLAGTSILSGDFQIVESVIRQLLNLNPYLLAGGLLLIILSILGFSLAVSQAIIAKKEY
ncbi:MAG: ABC-2 transporter permease [Clostridiaceae bacterium]|nr:ABC-2 transporter permease [Clostridiaceae bacterium]